MKLTQGQISEMISDLTENKESFSLLMGEILNSLMKQERSLWQGGVLGKQQWLPSPTLAFWPFGIRPSDSPEPSGELSSDAFRDYPKRGRREGPSLFIALQQGVNHGAD